MLKRLIAALAVVPCLAGGALAQDAAPNKLITILTAAEPQTQLMAMVLTANAVKAGARAQILLCGPAGDIALKDAPAAATAGQPPKGASPQGLMQMLMTQMQVPVQVCAIYLPGRGADASVLLDGVTAATPDAMGAAIIAQDTTVLSF